MSTPKRSEGGCCAWLLIGAGIFFLFGLFSFEPISMLLCGILGGLLIYTGVRWRSSGKTAPPNAAHTTGPGLPRAPEPHRAQFTSDTKVDDFARTERREHTPPVPRGTPVRPWVEVSRTTEVAGEWYRDVTYERIFQGMPKDGTWSNFDLDADLYPDPHNPHSERGNAVAVWVQGMHAGFLPTGTSGRYSPLLRDLAENHAQYLRVRARVSATWDARRSKWRPEVRLGLPEPENVLPRNQMPAGELELIPAGRVIQVTGEENHMDYLSTIVDPHGPAHYVAELRPIQMGNRTFYDTVQVLIDGNEIGTFSRAMGDQTVALVKLILAAGRVPVARATIEGNTLRAEAKVRMQRSAEFDHDRIGALRAIARERAASTNHRGEPFDWDDDDFMPAPGSSAGRGPEAPRQQDRDAEEGGA